MRILTVDNSRVIIPYFKYLFKDLDNATWVGHAFNVEEAEDFMQKEQPDVILLDLSLKNGNSLRLLKSFRKNYPAVKVFVLSNSKDYFYTQKCKEQGAFKLIDKTEEFHLIPLFLQALNDGDENGKSM